MGVVLEPPPVPCSPETSKVQTMRIIVRLLESSGINDPTGTNTRTLDVPTSISVGEVASIVNETFKISVSDYFFHMDDINLNNCSLAAELTLVASEYTTSTSATNLEVTVGQYMSKIAMQPEEDMALGASASPTGTEKMYWYDTDTPVGQSSTWSRVTVDSKDTDPPPLAIEYQPRSFKRQETGFVGLVNQAMTCYLNSLLQALFMTPEFRNALYRWEFKGSDQEGTNSIPFQLQKLFLQLQTTSRSAVETTNLTQSFGWDSSEAWQQHDIQELCRVMFDALERCFKNTDQADLISNLYEGKMKDYVKCLACGTENAREDTFLDIPLPIKPFGSSEAFQSLEEALRAFVEPEMLTDNNKYECSKCNCLCDAHKGLKFTRFPYLLTIHLKRFDFDYQSFLRIKLNDKVTFPKDLNLNSFIVDESADEGHTDVKVETSLATSEKTDDTSTTDSGAGLDTEDCSNGGLTPPHQDPREEDEGIDLGASCQEKTSAPSGPFTYELFSIMVHSGSAAGGHYYAYIKDFKSDNWFCFNDQSVSTITYDDIRRTYGGSGSRSFYSSSSANAYMLIYRQSNSVRNSNFFPAEECPTHIKHLATRMAEEEVADRQARELERNMMRITICSQHVTKGGAVQADIKIHKEETLAALTKLAWTELEFDQVIPLHRCRLVSYEALYDNFECAYDNREHETVLSIIHSQSTYRKPCFYLETREENETFEDYKDGGTSIKVYKVDVAAEEVDGPFTVRINLDSNVTQFRDLIAENLGLDVEKIRMAKEERCPKDIVSLEPSKSSLKREDIQRSTKIFVEASGLDNATLFRESLLYKVIDRFDHTKYVVVRLPDTSNEILESLQILPYVEEVTEPAPLPVPTVTIVTSSVSPCKELSCTNESKTCAPPTPDTSSTMSTVTSTSIDSSTKVVNSCQSKQPVCHVPSVASKLPVSASQIPASASSSSNLSDNEDDGAGDCEANLSMVNSDQSASEDSSLTSDSDRTLVGDPPEDNLSQRGHSPDYNHAGSRSRKKHAGFASDVSSPEDEAKDEHGACAWDYATSRTNYMDAFTTDEDPKYFRVTPKEDDDRALNVAVDNRMSVRQFTRELQKHVGVSQEHFKLYTLHYNTTEPVECSRPRETLVSLGLEFDVVLSRALQPGEYLVKVYSIDVENSEDPAHFLLEVIISEGESVLHVKQNLLEELKQKYDKSLTTETLRLRKKSWKNPQTIFLDAQLFTKDIPFSQMNELYIQKLDTFEIKSSREDELCLFAKRWRPSSYSTDPLVEFIVPEGTIDSLIEQLATISGIEKENVHFAKGRSTFPCDMSVIDIELDLDWKQRVGDLGQEPLYIMDDGCVIYYMDKTEETKLLTVDERTELTSSENVRLHREYATFVVPTVVKKTRERGLKIYLNNQSD